MTKRRLLLVSSSRVHGTGYLDHCEDEITQLLAGRRSLLFVPWAQEDLGGYAALVRERFGRLGVELASIHEARDPARALAEAEALFIGGGNTFRLLTALYETAMLDPIRRRVAAGMPYLGSSAGSNVACATIKTTNDMPIVYPPSFDALGLVPFNLNPHYLDPDPASTHMGETRETRIREFHEMNEPPVLGLREGSMVAVEGDRAVLLGKTGARLFRRGEAAVELEPGADLSFLLQPEGSTRAE